MKKLLIKFLIRLLDVPSVAHDKEKEESWLARSFEDQGFQSYASNRTRTMLHELGGGMGTEPLPRDNYMLKYGQRLENLLFIAKCKNAHAKKEREKKEKSVLKK